MSLQAGQTLSHYRLVEKIGEGGMGVVWKAVDTALDREVAVKVLPDAFAADAQRLARLEREAKLLASLNHPNIATVYGLHQHQDVRFIAMELVPGEDLACRFRRGPLSIAQTLEIGQQVSQAVEAAHARRVIHRDLKPANIKFGSDGKVKVLDFGLARMLRGNDQLRGVTTLATITSDETTPGVVLGTAAYMSPEQARGETVDERSDIWALGCILWEALAGKRPFTGDTASAMIAAILRDEPDWEALPSHVPVSLRTLLRRCLNKNADSRLHDMADVRIHVEDAAQELDQPQQRLAPARRWVRPRWRSVILFAVALAVVVAAAFIGFRVLEPSPTGPLEFSVPLPAGVSVAVGKGKVLALSPDGRRLVFRGHRDMVVGLYLYDMAQGKAKFIEGTEHATYPFFSPDGQWIAFFADHKLKKVSADGGLVLTLCDAPQSSGGAWREDGLVVFASAKGAYGLYGVDASGGTPHPIGAALRAKQDYFCPSVLPGKEAVLAVVGRDFTYEENQIGIVPLDGNESRLLAKGDYSPAYLSTGHVVYSHGPLLRALKLDLSNMRARGEPFIVAQNMMLTQPPARWRQVNEFALSPDGTLAYIREFAQEEASAKPIAGKPVAVQRNGEIVPINAPGGDYDFPNLSPDGRRLALTMDTGEGRRTWILDLEREVLTPFTFGRNDHLPIWTPDGSRITFSSDRDGAANLYWKNSDGSGEAERLTWSDHHQCPCSWSPDGQALVYGEFTPETAGDLWVLRPGEANSPEPLIKTAFVEAYGMISRDGRWIAYMSTRSGRSEVYVQPFGRPGAWMQVSTAGGTQPMWSPDGTELYYRQYHRSEDNVGSEIPLTHFMVVDVDTSDGITVGSPREMFQGMFAWHDAARPNYDISRDNSRFVMIVATEEVEFIREIRIVLNWSEQLRALE